MAKTHSDTIKFAHSVRGTILLESALPVLLTHTVISGPGSALLTVAAIPRRCNRSASSP